MAQFIKNKKTIFVGFFACKNKKKLNFFISESDFGRN